MTILNISIAAGADDGFVYPTTDGPANFFDTGTEIYLGNNDPGAGPRVANGWFRFAAVNIPNSAQINTAYMTNYRGSCSASVFLKIYAEDQDNPPATSDATDWFSATLTTAAVDWDPVTTDTGAVFNGPEIKTIIKEIVDRPGWAYGNAIQLMVKDDGSTADRKLVVDSLEGVREEPRLYIDFIDGGQYIQWSSA